MGKTPEEQWIDAHLPFDVAVARTFIDLLRRVKELEEELQLFRDSRIVGRMHEAEDFEMQLEQRIEKLEDRHVGNPTH